MKKSHLIIYWIATVWLALGMVSTGILQLSHAEAKDALAPPGVFGMQHLGYPEYLLTLIGVWKLLGSVAILMPRFPLIKEWAYVGFFFLMTGAIYSHIAVQDAFVENLPGLLLLVLTIISWYFRPASRRLQRKSNI